MHALFEPFKTLQLLYTPAVRPEPVEGHIASVMSFWVYMLKCADDSYYVDHTDNLDERMWKHINGQTAGYTASRLPVQLVFSQDHSTREEALAAERQIKGWSRKKKEAMIRGDWNEVSRLARSKSSGNAVHPSTSSGRTEKE